MAFLTQKDFFRIGFPSDDLAMRREPTQASTHLKGYASCMDTRAWSFQKHAQARFVSDEVHRMDDGNVSSLVVTPFEVSYMLIVTF